MKKRKMKKMLISMADELFMKDVVIDELNIKLEEKEEDKHIVPIEKVEADIDKAAIYLSETRDRLTPLGIKYLLLELLKEYDCSLEMGIAHRKEDTDPGPKAIRQGSIEVKTTGQLIDELIIMNQRIWMLIDKVIAGVATPDEAQNVQKYNAQRNEYVRALDRRLNNAIQYDPDAPEPNNFLGAKVYGPKV